MALRARRLYRALLPAARSANELCLLSLSETLWTLGETLCPMAFLLVRCPLDCFAALRTGLGPAPPGRRQDCPPPAMECSRGLSRAHLEAAIVGRRLSTQTSQDSPRRRPRATEHREKQEFWTLRAQVRSSTARSASFVAPWPSVALGLLRGESWLACLLAGDGANAQVALPKNPHHPKQRWVTMLAAAPGDGHDGLNGRWPGLLAFVRLPWSADASR